IGGALAASVDPDRLLVSGSGLVSGLDRLLGMLAHVLTGATYPEAEVVAERERLADRIRVARTQPSFLARAALLRRMYGDHPYAVQTPDPEQVLAVARRSLRDLHAQRVHPAGATLVPVSVIDPPRVLDDDEGELASRDSAGPPSELPPATPPLPLPTQL